MPKKKETKKKTKKKEEKNKPELVDRELIILGMHLTVHIKSENNEDTLDKMKDMAYEIIDKYKN